MSFFIPIANAQVAASPASSSSIVSWLFIGGMFLLMYMMIIRPQQKRQKEHKNLVESLAKGDEVVTNGGILGKIVKVDESYMVLNVSNNVDLKFQKASLHAVLPKGTIKAI